MDHLYATYHGHVEFFVVYIKEAHPSDGRAVAGNTRAGISVKEPTNFTERQKVAGQACEEMKLRWACLVDDLDNSVSQAYAAWPTRLYIVDTDGRIAVAGDPGPRGLAPAMKAAREWLNGYTRQIESTDRDSGKPVAR